MVLANKDRPNDDDELIQSLTKILQLIADDIAHRQTPTAIYSNMLNNRDETLTATTMFSWSSVSSE